MQSTSTTVRLGQMNTTNADMNKQLENRAARFGLVTAGPPTEEKKLARAARFGEIKTSSSTTPNSGGKQQAATPTTDLSEAEKAKQLRAARFGSLVKQPDQQSTRPSSGTKPAFVKTPKPQPKEEDPVKLARAARFAQTKLN